MFLSICVLDDFFLFSKKLGFWVFLIQPIVVLVLLSASVERCFVSRMRDFLLLDSLQRVFNLGKMSKGGGLGLGVPKGLEHFFQDFYHFSLSKSAGIWKKLSNVYNIFRGRQY